VDALFTATSAVCVTGLIVVDTGTYFTPFGQGVILGLIQVGGLGIMTFSVLFYRLLGTGISLRDRIIVQSSFSPLNKGDVLELVRSIFIYTFLIEATGTLLLFFGWPGGSVSWRCLWVAIFHSVSAFCNAGFSLFSDSLMSFQSNWWVNVIITSLIICGGLGFVRLQQERHARLSLHSKIVLATTGSLILGGTLLFLVLEFNNSLVTVPLHGKILVSYFQSVTARTAGFNTVNLYNLANPTLFVLIILMFIGASPGSCGGNYGKESIQRQGRGRGVQANHTQRDPQPIRDHYLEFCCVDICSCLSGDDRGDGWLYALRNEGKVFGISF